MHLRCVSSTLAALCPGPTGQCPQRTSSEPQGQSSHLFFRAGAVQKKGIPRDRKPAPHPGVAAVMVEIGFCQGNPKSMQQRHCT